MKALLALFFALIATIQLGLFAGLFSYQQSEKSTESNFQYWFGSLLLSSLGLLIFGGGILSVQDIARPAFIFTIANTCFYASGVLQTLYCISLNRAIDKKIAVLSVASALIFVVIFEYLRQVSFFEIRTMILVFIGSIFYCTQIFQVKNCRNQDKSRQLLYLQIATFLELIFAISRLIVLLANGFWWRSVEELPQILIVITFAQLVMNTLSYIAIAGYKFEKLGYAKAKSDSEREISERKFIETSEVLKEKERLIYGLMKANKTVATGALSASIAHELNQPLGASNLNIHFLKMKLDKGFVDLELFNEILNSLERDNDRATTIVKSLRSIFSDSNANIEQVELSNLIYKVLDIVRPELRSKNIQMQMNVESGLIIKANPTEIEQVILNLINNAIQSLAVFGGSTRSITINALQNDSSVRLAIMDSGDGVQEKFKPQLFELLSTTKQSGMGLGLWLCKYIITRYGGSINYEDRPEGGASFVVQIPSG